MVITAVYGSNTVWLGEVFGLILRVWNLLKELNRSYYSDISGRVAAKRAELESIQLFNLVHVNQRRLEEESKLRDDLVALEDVESEFYKQRAKVHWLQEVVLEEFFKDLIGTTDPSVQGCSAEWLKSVLTYSLPPGAADGLTSEITNAEIKDALFRQGNNKSPSPDGYTPWFFKVAWDIVCNDFLKAVRYFFQTSIILPAFNATVLVLAPKSLNVCMAKGFRPISCCYVFYKTITRILVSRLALFFPDMISLNQSVFVKGRNIADNTLLAQETVKGYSRKNLSPRCTIKVDLHKAFDSIGWDFLMTVLEAMGLPEVFCGWIKACITTPRYSISLNGSLVGFFKGAKGVRQGDPLSPYLFVIVMNVLSTLLDAVAMNGVFKFHPKCKRIPLTHLCFADDLLLFCHGSLDAILGVVSTLEKFYEISGLKLNALKSELFACGVARDELEVIQSRIDNWSSRKLSFGGRLQLVKSVIFSIFGYWCSDTSARGARVSWNQICTLKSEGGLGLRKLADWSKACCFMLFKNILVGEGSLWIAWVKSYCFKSVHYWEVDSKAHFSWTLCKLIKMREEARRLFCSMANLSQIKGSWIWENIRKMREKVDWHRLIWFPAHVPKFSVVSWMVMLDRLTTKDRLRRFGIVTDNLCGLCGASQETRNHLFLECSYSCEVWRSIMNFCGLHYQLPSYWDDAIRWMVLNFKGKSLLIYILKLAWTSFVYFIWEERNHRCFRGVTRSTDLIVNRISETVRIKLHRCHMNRSDAVNSQLCLNWGLIL
ncbi:uncharacterized protein LOC120169819 [Hibiscus syriacus]|uniref:uncharacterized protein LOC120169819 n=1 Tax=Hibiscus syriacus TaxID=106335 RepID=UPI00192071C5|nr:uncharacterized protein LOC120169819 [Hibiscus syriacus]